MYDIKQLPRDHPVCREIESGYFQDFGELLTALGAQIDIPSEMARNFLSILMLLSKTRAAATDPGITRKGEIDAMF